MVAAQSMMLEPQQSQSGIKGLEGSFTTLGG